jgi:hypothetical protein
MADLQTLRRAIERLHDAVAARGRAIFPRVYILKTRMDARAMTKNADKKTKNADKKTKNAASRWPIDRSCPAFSAAGRNEAHDDKRRQEDDERRLFRCRSDLAWLALKTSNGREQPMRRFLVFLILLSLPFTNAAAIAFDSPSPSTTGTYAVYWDYPLGCYYSGYYWECFILYEDDGTGPVAVSWEQGSTAYYVNGKPPGTYSYYVEWYVLEYGFSYVVEGPAVMEVVPP